MLPILNSIAPTLLGLSITVPLRDGERKVTTVAEGVYVIEHEDRGDGFASGNTTVIVGDRQVLVVDTGFLPSAASEDIAQIRRWTDKPVTFVVTTHFHNDHNFGNRIYATAFPTATFIAHRETKVDMDRFGPGSVARLERGRASLRKMRDTGKSADGHALTAAEKTEVEKALADRERVIAEMTPVTFQSATMTFDRELDLDLGNRPVRIEFLGRGNTSGDAIVYLPKERLVVAGDLVVFPIPYVFDGYPSDWVGTLENLGRIDADAIVPGHGPVLHDKTYLNLVHDLVKSTVDQLNTRLGQTRPAMAQTVDDVKDAIDLAPFRQRFAGTDRDRGAEFDQMAASLISVAFREASLR